MSVTREAPTAQKTDSQPDEAERWIRIDAAAAGLGVGVKRAYQLADLDQWRRTGGKPTRYALTDVRATHARRASELS